ncbi:MAG TPA: DUF421 domain-containing protein [Rhodopila sp.]|nr:DUF421 domain-containing protein [Rhodopila sp.]
MSHFFGPNHHLLWWQECDRAVVIFIYGLIMVRLAGRRTFSKWGALDTIVSIIVGSNLSRALTGSASMDGTLAATTLIFAAHWGLARLAARYNLASRLLEGAPKILARDGKLDPRIRRSEAISHIDLGEALRAKQLEDVSASRLVVLEPNGTINVLKAE